MDKNLLNFNYFFGALVVLDVMVANSSLNQYRILTKPLILLSLLIYFLFSGKHLTKKTYYLTVVALACSLLGDVFLLFDSVSNLYFILGLISFLLAHLAYGYVFLKKWNQKPRWKIHTYTLALISYGVGLFLYLKPGLGTLTYPVSLYVLGILLMAISALRRYQNVNKKSFLFVFIGAIFFVISDSVLAINMFKEEIQWASFFIMSTYALAQFLIVKGILSQNNN
jgi:uncharacterized membrane protein YhhN